MPGRQRYSIALVAHESSKTHLLPRRDLRRAPYPRDVIVPARVRGDERRLGNEQASGSPRALAVIRRHHWGDRDMRLLRRPVARQRSEDDAVLERLRADFNRAKERREVLRAVRRWLE